MSLSAGAIKIQRNWGKVPERWQVLFAVTDLDRIIDQAHGLGGSDDLPIIDIPNVGRCASLLDQRQGLFIAHAARPEVASSLTSCRTAQNSAACTVARQRRRR